jgi:hypothetical protein
MANLLVSHPNLSLHLVDTSTTPILSTSSSHPESLDALTALANTSLTAADAALRLGLGSPQRIVVEYSTGPVLLSAHLQPPASPETTAAATQSSVMGSINGIPLSPASPGVGSGATAAEEPTAPALLAIVVAPGLESLPDAKRAVGKLERVGRLVQAELAAEDARKAEESGSPDRGAVAE